MINPVTSPSSSSVGEEFRDVKAEVKTGLCQGIINAVKVTNESDWTWPVIKLLVNDHFSLIAKEWKPLESRCLCLNDFKWIKYGQSFTGMPADVRSFEITVFIKYPGKVIGHWKGEHQ